MIPLQFHFIYQINILLKVFLNPFLDPLCRDLPREQDRPRSSVSRDEIHVKVAAYQDSIVNSSDQCPKSITELPS